MDDFLTINEHKEFAKRMEEEHIRQNHRIGVLEKLVEENRNLALSIERLTISVQNMVSEQKAQGERLEALEDRDGEMWRKAMGYLLTAVIGGVVGFMFKKVGM